MTRAEAAAARLDHIGAVLGPVDTQAEGVGDSALAGMLRAADADLRQMRDLLNSDPLMFWLDNRVDTTGLDKLLRQAQAVAELARLRTDADSRVAQAAETVAVAQASEQDARAACDEAARKITAARLVAVPPATRALRQRLAGLDALRQAGLWPRLASEIEAIEPDSAVAAARWKEAGLAARALLDRRDELRGLLDAYRAKACRLGAAEKPHLDLIHRRAHDLLGSAPCDLTQSGAAVRGYQEAILALQKGAS